MNASCMDRETALRALLERAVADGVTPGLAAKVVAFHDIGVEHANPTQTTSLTLTAGRTSHLDAGRRVSSDTPYDLASLTKILSTTLLAAHAVAAGKMRLRETPWPSWPDVTIEHVMRHQSGLPAWRPFFETLRETPFASTPNGNSALIEAVLATRPEVPPATRTLYSDLGFIALGNLLEERLEMTLDVAFEAVAASGYGPTSLQYVPLWRAGFHPRYVDVAPTEACPWRNRTVQGQVHDDNAFVMGGVAGHAGLFGSLNDVAQASQRLLHHVMRPRSALAHALASFVQVDGERGLGFDRPTPGGTTGDALSPFAFGHLGFTGTSVWMDPSGPGAGGALYVLLTNRVHPTRTNDGIRALRSAFHQHARAWLNAALGGD